MANKGYPSQKKLSEKIVGVSTVGCTDEYQTFQPNYSNQISADVINKGLFRLSGGLTVTAASTISPKRGFTCTSHGGSVGDVVRFQPTGTANPGFEATIIQVPTVNTLVLGSEAPNNIATNDAFYILRHITPTYQDDGTITVTSSSSPIEYSLNGADTVVSMDTATPANSRPLPVQYLNTLGVRTDLATLGEQQTQTTALGTLNTSVNTLLKPADTLAGVTTVGTVTAVTAITNALPAGANNIGDVDVLSVPANMSVNTTQLGGIAINLGAGNTGTGTQRVVIADNQTAIPVSQSGTWNVVPAANSTVDVTRLGGNTIQTNGGNRSVGTLTVTMCDNQPAIAQNVTQINTQTVGAGQGQATAGTMRVCLATEDTAVVTSVSDSASSGQLLASNSSRQQATFFNNSTESLYLKFGVTASATDFTVRIAPGGYYELPGPTVFTGRIDGIWSANASGAVLITEY